MDTQFPAHKKIIDNEERIGKSNIRLRNLYKISQYKYADGKSRNLKMEWPKYVFLFGRVGDVLHGVKLKCRKTYRFLRIFK